MSAWEADDPASADLVPGMLAERIMRPESQAWLRQVFADTLLVQETMAESSGPADFWRRLFAFAGWTAKPGSWALMAATAGLVDLIPAPSAVELSLRAELKLLTKAAAEAGIQGPSHAPPPPPEEKPGIQVAPW